MLLPVRQKMRIFWAMDNVSKPYPPIEALIFDLDGVVTTTRELHLKAWTRLFNSMLESRGVSPDFSAKDYNLYVDGKPRLEGIGSFLESRKITLPPGDAGDPPGNESIYALGHKKNKLFLEYLEQNGVQVYDDAVNFIKEWRKQSLPTAIVSSSRNCKKILEIAGIDCLFDVRIDGQVSAERGMKGKPAPDIFIEAARLLDARPERSAAFEDAVSGVAAARAGLFGLVVGVARFENAGELLAHGADMTIENFAGFELSQDSVKSYFRATTPHALHKKEGVTPLLEDKKPVFFLDYDGTLTPIVKKPEDAVLSDKMREVLEELAERFTVSVVTGRDKEDVEKLVGLKDIVYSGSHGYVISGPGGLSMEHEQSEQIISLMDEVEEELKLAMKNMDKGFKLDRKRYAIALHYRNAEQKNVQGLFDLVDQMLTRFDKLKTGEGKKVVELKPDIDWHKGKAVLWILEALGLDKRNDILPIYIGDDITDEDAFEALKELGIGILVEDRGQDTAAAFHLKDVYQVRRFFEQIIQHNRKDQHTYE